ncbi:hypothetical protein [Lyngbya aestuarii]|uniref:hypothetical protein n=1 Tax=Lyngbya aestuarii TaxID=118322 RepID=UPI00403D5802
MINRLFWFCWSQRQRFNPWQLPLTGLLLVVGLAFTSSSWATTTPQQQEAKANSTKVTKSAADNTIPDGTYLYGESSQANVLGNEYMVFESRQGKVIGALYLPQSEYSCFYGTLDADKMSLTVVNPYDQTALAHVIERQQRSPIAAASSQLTLDDRYSSLNYPHAVGLEGYQPIGELSEQDQQMLKECQGNYQNHLEN